MAFSGWFPLSFVQQPYSGIANNFTIWPWHVGDLYYELSGVEKTIGLVPVMANAYTGQSFNSLIARITGVESGYLIKLSPNAEVVKATSFIFNTNTNQNGISINDSSGVIFTAYDDASSAVHLLKFDGRSLFAFGTDSGFLNLGSEVLPYGTGYLNRLKIGANGSIDFNNISPNPTYREGRLFYDSTESALSYYNDISTETVAIGQELLVKVRNNYGTTILKGQPVYTSGSQGNRPAVALASSSGTKEAHCLGLASSDIANGADGYVSSHGTLRTVPKSNMGLGTVTVGDSLFLTGVAGYLSTTSPTYMNYEVQVGVITKIAGNNIDIFIDKLDHNKLVLDGANTVLGVNSSATAQEYKSIVGIGGVTVTHSQGQITLSGSAAAGTVTGPVASIDKEIPRFNGTTGQVIQSGSRWTITDSGNMIPLDSGMQSIASNLFPLSGICSNQYSTTLLQQSLGGISSIDLFWRNGSSQKLNFSSGLSGNVSVNLFDGIPGSTYILNTVQNPSGTTNVVWGTNVKWQGGVSGNMTGSGNANDIFSFYFDGTNYLSSYTSNYF